MKSKTRAELENLYTDLLMELYIFNTLTPSRESALAITKLQESQSWFSTPPLPKIDINKTT